MLFAFGECELGMDVRPVPPAMAMLTILNWGNVFRNGDDNRSFMSSRFYLS
jgi:hypothetical protein